MSDLLTGFILGVCGLAILVMVGALTGVYQLVIVL